MIEPALLDLRAVTVAALTIAGLAIAAWTQRHRLTDWLDR